MAPFEALYGRPCKSPLNWLETGESRLVGSALAQDCSEKIKLIQQWMQVAQQRQKQYADRRRKVLVFQGGDHVFLRVSPKRSVQVWQAREAETEVCWTIPDHL